MSWTGLVPSGSELRRTLHNWVAGVVLATGVAAGVTLGAAVLVQPAAAKTPVDGAVAMQSVAFATLPAEGQTTHQAVLNGGPFAYAKDGIVFGNRERLLPRQGRGFYREYTVKTPGSRDRGARRIVCGGQPPSRPEACYYTDDHYASFRRIVP